MLRVDSEGYKIGAVILTVAVLLRIVYGVIGWQILLWAALFCIVLAGYTLYFFRDPHRIVPEEKGAAVSSADGVTHVTSTTLRERCRAQSTVATVPQQAKRST